MLFVQIHVHVCISLWSHTSAFNSALALLGLSSAVAFALVLGCMMYDVNITAGSWTELWCCWYVGSIKLRLYNIPKWVCNNRGCALYIGLLFSATWTAAALSVHPFWCIHACCTHTLPARKFDTRRRVKVLYFQYTACCSNWHSHSSSSLGHTSHVAGTAAEPCLF